MDISRGETIEVELDQLIERRARQREDEERVEAAWKESARRHRARKLEENRLAWVAYFQRLSASHLDLAATSWQRAQTLLGPLDEPTEQGGE